MGICLDGLEKFGLVINRKCEGLPLAIVIAAGLVKNNLSVTWWEQIAASLHTFMVTFTKDYEVPVTKLIWLWIAQGFIHETTSRMLEDVAVDFLLDLIRRSLVMASRKKSDGQVKTCRIHDLLHDFCLRKAEEENFLANKYRYGMLSSMLCFPLELGKSLQEGGSIHIDTYTFLKILDLESILISLFVGLIGSVYGSRVGALSDHSLTGYGSTCKRVKWVAIAGIFWVTFN
ncbi:putative winged helix-like DNA-binding domain superfamily [Helianthus debilis subsp. tardiflorus]